MEQVYFVRNGTEGLECVYQYGNYTYFGPITMHVPAGAHELESALAEIQREQGAIPFFAETAKIDPGTLAGRCLASLSSALGFIREELDSVVEEIAGLATTETWLDAEDSLLYFEFETRAAFPMMDAQVVFAKSYQGEIMTTAIFFGGRFYVTLTEAAAKEQDLVDTLFPQIGGHRRGLQLRSYDHPQFVRMGVWEAGEPLETDADAGIASAKETTSHSAAAAVGAAGTSSADGDDEAELGLLADMSGPGYMQIYIVKTPEIGSGSREALFRYGSWVYTGKVDFGVPALHLGDIPEMLPALQRQQGKLGYTCEVTSFPTASPFFQVVRQYMAAVQFLHDEMIAVQDTLAAMAEVGVTSWIDAEWAASFFELSLELTPELAAVEAIASKTYFPSGIVLHCVLFAGSLYCVLATSAEDLPLLDVAFPDVTARCRGAQVKAYAAGEGPPGARMPTARRLTVWEGRRKGVKGVGWGTGAAVEGDTTGANLAAEIRGKARARAEEEEAARRATVAMLGGRKEAALAATTEAAAASAAVAVASSAVAVPSSTSPAPTVASSTGSSGVAGVQAATAAPAARAAAVSATASAAKAPHHLPPLGGARAPHHLPPMGGGASGPGGRLLAGLPSLDPAFAAAPWDKSGKPLKHNA